MSDSHGRRLREQVWALAEGNVAEWSRLDPCGAIVSGVAVSGVALTDYGDEACQDRAALARRTRDSAAALLAELSPGPAAVAAAVIAERCGIEVDLYESGQLQRRLDVVTCPLQEVRRAIELTVPADRGPDDGEDVLAVDDAWLTFAERLVQVPASLDSYLLGLGAAADRGDVPALRQVEAVATQCEHLADGGHFAGLVTSRATGWKEPAPGVDVSRLRAAAAAADAAYAHAARWLRQELEPGPAPTIPSAPSATHSGHAGTSAPTSTCAQRTRGLPRSSSAWRGARRRPPRESTRTRACVR